MLMTHIQHNNYKGNTILFHPFLLCNYHYNLNHAENKYYNYYNKGSPLIRYKLKHVERKYYNDYNKRSLLTKYKVYI